MDAAQIAPAKQPLSTIINIIIIPLCQLTSIPRDGASSRWSAYVVFVIYHIAVRYAYGSETYNGALWIVQPKQIYLENAHESSLEQTLHFDVKGSVITSFTCFYRINILSWTLHN